MRTKRLYKDSETQNFDLSISDLMSALCGIFALIMITVVIQLNMTKAEYISKNRKAEEYYSMQYELYLDLTKEFENDLQRWNAEITKDLTIRFKDSNVLFEPEKADLKSDFEFILQDFFPRLISVLEKDEYKNEIDEIRIEGHTARNEYMSKNADYITGMELSQQRTTKVMLYCLNTIPQKRDWVQHNIAAIGYSNSRPIFVDGNVNKASSRRVEFRIKTKAEKVVEELADMEFKSKHE